MFQILKCLDTPCDVYLIIPGMPPCVLYKHMPHWEESPCPGNSSFSLDRARPQVTSIYLDQILPILSPLGCRSQNLAAIDKSFSLSTRNQEERSSKEDDMCGAAVAEFIEHLGPNVDDTTDMGKGSDVLVGEKVNSTSSLELIGLK